MKTYRYDPDGFVATEQVGARIIHELADRNGLVLGDWDTYGADGQERMLVWDSEESANDDSGAKALCQIVRTAQPI